MMQRTSLLEYKNNRYLKLTALLITMVILAYLFINPTHGRHYGGTYLGYILGTISLLILLLLAWYGIRKRMTPRQANRRKYQRSARRKQSNAVVNDNSIKRKQGDRRKCSAKESWLYGGSMQGWLAAHIYLGSSLIILTTLHTGFQLGWNIHSLSYILMLLVVASGLYGTLAYLKYPRLIAQNIGADTLQSLLKKIAELDEIIRVQALDLPDEVNLLVTKAREKTRLGGNALQQLSGKHIDCPTVAAVHQIQKLSEKYVFDKQPKLMRDLYSVMLRKQTLVLRARNEVMMKARMQFWLYFHAPLTAALLVALFAHILAIFFYW